MNININFEKDLKIEHENLYETIENNLEKEITKNITFQMLNKNYKSLKIIEKPVDFEKEENKNLEKDFKERMKEFVLNLNSLELKRKNAGFNQRKNSGKEKLIKNEFKIQINDNNSKKSGQNLIKNEFNNKMVFEKNKKINFSLNSKKTLSHKSFDFEKLNSHFDDNSDLFINSQDINLMEKRKISRKTFKYDIETPRDLMSLQSYSKSISQKSEN